MLDDPITYKEYQKLTEEAPINSVASDGVANYDPLLIKTKRKKKSEKHQ